MKILIACEESQAVCIEFRKLGHEAYSCDIQECSGSHPEWHIQGDVLQQLNKGWDMMIAFPPCTHLTVAGAKYFEIKKKDGRQQEGIDFFMNIINAPIEKICVENPVGIMSSIFRKPDQIIEPYFFGDRDKKRTCLWLKNLPKLIHIKENDLFDKKTHTEYPEPYRIEKSGKKRYFTDGKASGSIERSKTFPGIAKNMALQWGNI
jgi:site-specific DNA-cytosine methylase